MKYISKLFVLFSLIFFVEQQSSAETTEINSLKKRPTEITIVPGSYESVPLIEPPPTEEKGKLYSGKKVAITNLKALPEVSSNNNQQLFSQIPGLLVSEVPNNSLNSFSYRGLGDPHETFNLNVLQDDIPLNFDLYGYPAVYYAPPSEFLDQVEFVHGGAALLYGAQPGGALNFRTREPNYKDVFSGRTKQVFGSKNLYNTYNEVSGTKGNTSYLLAYSHRETDGFRVRNSNSRSDFASLKLEQKLTDSTKVTFEQDIYDSSFGEAGGLSLVSGPGLANYQTDRWQTSLNYDTLSIRRYVTSVGLEHKVDSKTQIYTKLWGGFNSRNSKRQSYGTAQTFGGIANGDTNTIQLQEFKNVGFQTRGTHNWTLNEEKQTFTAGVLLYGMDSPFRTETGATPNAEVGTLNRNLARTTLAGAVFMENKFEFGDFTITPGARVENIYQDVDEKYNINRNDSLLSTNSTNSVPLLGLGSTYKLFRSYEAYGNFSQGYKPVTFQDSLPLGPTDQISSNINEAKTNNFEVGVRGNPFHYVSVDASLFYTTYSNQFGRVGQMITNTGKGRYYGVDLSTTLDLMTLNDSLFKTNLRHEFGVFSLYGNASILNAEFTGGPLEGNTPQYAPRYLIKTGVIYNPIENTKIALIGNFTADHYADDGDSLSFYIPSYKVWDLTVDFSVIKNRLILTGGINNLFDENYYSRIRSNGIDPSAPRNLYAGFNLYF